VSACQSPGPRTRFRPALPNVPLAGTEKAVMLIQSATVDPPDGINDVAEVTFGRCGDDEFPSGTAPALRSTVTFTGSPVRAVAIRLHSQPPNTARARPG